MHYEVLSKEVENIRRL